jgi:hypothetical protein
MYRLKEIAKFACGAVAFDAFFHTYFWASGTSLTVFGITQTVDAELDWRHRQCRDFELFRRLCMAASSPAPEGIFP